MKSERKAPDSVSNPLSSKRSRTREFSKSKNHCRTKAASPVVAQKSQGESSQANPSSKSSALKGNSPPVDVVSDTANQPSVNSSVAAKQTTNSPLQSHAHVRTRQFKDACYEKPGVSAADEQSSSQLATKAELLVLKDWMTEQNAILRDNIRDDMRKLLGKKLQSKFTSA